MSVIKVHGARQNNLKDISLEIPKHQLTVFTGRSGSGKSSLVFNTLAAESERLLNESYSTYIQNQLVQYAKPDVDAIEHLPVAMIINQKRLGGNSRSTVGTISDIYASVRLLWSRIGEPFVGYSDIFSFNNPKGMCPTCSGLGYVEDIDLNELLDFDKSLNEDAIKFPSFRPDSWRGKRYLYTGLFDNDKSSKIILKMNSIRSFIPNLRNYLIHLRIGHAQPNSKDLCIVSDVRSYSMTTLKNNVSNKISTVW